MKFKKFIMKEMEVDLSGGEMTKSAEQTPAPVADKTDEIRMEIPLFIRVLEYAHENAKTDQEMHELTERAVKLSKERCLKMSDYEALVAELRRQPDDPNAAPPKEYATSKKDPASDAGLPTDPQSYGGQTAGLTN